MEMFLGIMTGVAVGWIAGKMMKLDDNMTIVVICFTGAGGIAAGLAWYFISQEAIGSSASPMWVAAGLVGGFAGLVLYRILTKLLYTPRQHH